MGEFIVPIPHVKQVKVGSTPSVNDFNFFLLLIRFDVQNSFSVLFSFQMLEEDSLLPLMVSGMRYLLIWQPNHVEVYRLSLLQGLLLRWCPA